MPQQTPIQQLCGVDIDLVERFLILIRDNYKKADQATFFLEQRTLEANVYGIANLRDVLSHLSTMLKPDISREKREAQLANAEEHLRRAIIEPYETAVNELMVQKFAALHHKYKSRVIPIKDRYEVLRAAPDNETIGQIFRDIEDLTSKGRTAKGKNLIDPEWEEGIACFPIAFDKLHTLYSQLEDYCNKFDQIERDQATNMQHNSIAGKVSKPPWLLIWNIVVTLLAVIFGIILFIR